MGMLSKLPGPKSTAKLSKMQAVGDLQPLPLFVRLKDLQHISSFSLVQMILDFDQDILRQFWFTFFTLHYFVHVCRFTLRLERPEIVDLSPGILADDSQMPHVSDWIAAGDLQLVGESARGR